MKGFLIRLGIGFLWAFSMGVAFVAGTNHGSELERNSREAMAARENATAESQVRHLLELAYPPDRHLPFVISVPPVPIAMKVEEHRSSPELVRAILYEEVGKEHTAFCTEPGLNAGPKSFWQGAGKTASDEYLRRLKDLRDWKP